MGDRRRIWLAAGTVALALAGASLHSPRVAEQFGAAENMLGFAGIVVAAAGAIAAVRFERAGRRFTAVDSVETAAEAPHPGSDVDDLLTAIDENRTVLVRYRGRTKRRLYLTAVGVLADLPDWSIEEAHTALHEGRWTDDPVAADFFAAGSAEPRPRRLLAAVAPWSSRSGTARAERAMTELAAIADDERRPSPPDRVLPRFGAASEDSDREGADGGDPATDAPEWATRVIDL